MVPELVIVDWRVLRQRNSRSKLSKDNQIFRSEYNEREKFSIISSLH